ncbi:hypothetical protein JZ751_007956 [Albula glossodonta]|uniref:NTR domain-containing protein n=1 Tax=Albula glossodonta TaxID=121402 RepID=A0A8T2P9D8_9TELE|nr:hypothetical protein JZ751_007956 [Albula glossodonta]
MERRWNLHITLQRLRSLLRGEGEFCASAALSVSHDQIAWTGRQAATSSCIRSLKMKIKEVKRENGDRKLVAAQKKKKVLKMGALRKKDLKKLVLYIKNGADCPCAQLDSLSSSFLIMGRKVDQQLLLTSIHKWDKKSKELKFAIKYMKSQQCPTFHTVFQ